MEKIKENEEVYLGTGRRTKISVLADRRKSPAEPKGVLHGSEKARDRRKPAKDLGAPRTNSPVYFKETGQRDIIINTVEKKRSQLLSMPRCWGSVHLRRAGKAELEKRSL